MSPELPTQQPLRRYELSANDLEMTAVDAFWEESSGKLYAPVYSSSGQLIPLAFGGDAEFTIRPLKDDHNRRNHHDEQALASIPGVEALPIVPLLRSDRRYSLRMASGDIVLVSAAGTVRSRQRALVQFTNHTGQPYPAQIILSEDAVEITEVYPL